MNRAWILPTTLVGLGILLIDIADIRETTHRRCRTHLHLQKRQAGMGKFNHFLTVRELTDLVAFLKTSQQLIRK